MKFNLKSIIATGLILASVTGTAFATTEGAVCGFLAPLPSPLQAAGCHPTTGDLQVNFSNISGAGNIGGYTSLAWNGTAADLLKTIGTDKITCHMTGIPGYFHMACDDVTTGTNNVLFANGVESLLQAGSVVADAKLTIA